MNNIKIVEAKYINESYKFNFSTNLSKERQSSKSYKSFMNKVNSFYVNILPKMDYRMSMYLDISELVGRGVTANLYIWGWNLICDDEWEFDRLYNKTDMEKQVGSIVKAALGNYSDIYVSTYWKSKLNIKNKSIETGPYVNITFSTEDMLFEAAYGMDIKTAKRVLDSRIESLYELDDSADKEYIDTLIDFINDNFEELKSKSKDSKLINSYRNKLNKAFKAAGLKYQIQESTIDEATPKEIMKSSQKKRLRENKKRQIEAIDANAQRSKQRIRTQYKNKIDMINRT